MKIYHILMCVLIIKAVEVPASSRMTEVLKHDAEKACEALNRTIYETNDKRFCCKCPPGYYRKSDCNFGTPESTTCAPCPFNSSDPNNQSWTDTENNRTKCFPSLNASYCDNLMNTYFITGSPTSNGRCKCKGGYYRSDPSSSSSGCLKHGDCDPGFQPSKVGTEVSNTECEICPSGTFSDLASPTALCVPFSVCTIPGETVLEEGTSETDVKCGVMTVPVTTPLVDLTTQLATTTVQPNSTFASSSSQVPPHAIWVPIVVVVIVVMVIYCVCKKNRKKPRKRVLEIDKQKQTSPGVDVEDENMKDPESGAKDTDKLLNGTNSPPVSHTKEGPNGYVLLNQNETTNGSANSHGKKKIAAEISAAYVKKPENGNGINKDSPADAHKTENKKSSETLQQGATKDMEETEVGKPASPNTSEKPVSPSDAKKLSGVKIDIPEEKIGTTQNKAFTIPDETEDKKSPETLQQRTGSEMDKTEEDKPASPNTSEKPINPNDAKKLSKVGNFGNGSDDSFIHEQHDITEKETVNIENKAVPIPDETEDKKSPETLQHRTGNEMDETEEDKPASPNTSEKPINEDDAKKLSKVESFGSGSDDNLILKEQDNAEEETVNLENKAVPIPDEDILNNYFTEEELQHARNDGISVLSIVEELNDYDSGNRMIGVLTKHSVRDVRPYIRKFLDEIEIDDVEHNHHGDVAEIRHQWVLRIRRKHGRNLTPKFIYDQGFDLNAMRDDMTDVFFNNLR